MSESQTAASPASGDASRLRPNVLSLSQIVASTLASIAPAMSFFFGFAMIVKGAGLGAPLTVITAMAGILLLTNTIAQFSRFMPSAGSFVAFIDKAFGTAAGAAASLFLTFGYIVAASTVVSIAGVWGAEVLKVFLGISLHWAVLTVSISGATGWLVIRGVALSTAWSGVFFYFEAGLLVLGSLLMLLANPHFLTLAPFRFSSLPGGLAGLSAGFPLAIYLFIGWENSATLAEEAKDPRRNIPRALVTGTLAIGIFYVFLAYATAVGFQMNAHALAAAPLPFIQALRNSSHSLVVVAYIAGITSILGSLVGLVNSQARILFNSGREGLLPAFLGKIHPRHQTPHSAIWVFLICAVGLVLGFSVVGGVAPRDYFGFAGTLGAIPILLIYMASNVALPVFLWRFHRSKLRVFRHVVVPLLGTLIMALPLWSLLRTGQPWPFNVFPWVVAGVLGLSVVYGVVVARWSPSLMQRVGAYVVDQSVQ
jgi:amino acid transporter